MEPWKDEMRCSRVEVTEAGLAPMVTESGLDVVSGNQVVCSRVGGRVGKKMHSQQGFCQDWG